MTIEYLKGLLKNRLDRLSGQEVSPQDMGDYQALLGHVTVDLQRCFGGSQIGDVDAPKRDDDQLGDCMQRLLAKKGNTPGKIANRLVKMAGGSDLEKDKFLHLQYEAVIMQSLKDIRVLRGL